MVCAECSRNFEGDDYLCWACRNPEDIERAEYRPPVYLGDLKGPEGNAWAVMGACHQAWRDAQKNGEVNPDVSYETIQKEMMSSSYEHLLDTVEKYFTPFIARPTPMQSVRLRDETIPDSTENV